jgi:hypothetical protein
MSMCLAFGATFEVPVVVVILVRMGLITVAKLKEIRPYAIVGAFVIAAIVTPPDAVSQLAGDSDVPAVRTGPAGGAAVRADFDGARRKGLKGLSLLRPRFSPNRADFTSAAG